MKSFFQLAVAICAVAAGYHFGGTAGNMLYGFAAIAVLGAFVQWLQGGRSKIVGAAGLFIAIVTALLLVTAAEPRWVGRILAAVAALGGLGCLAKTGVKGRLVEVVPARRGKWRTQLALGGFALGLALVFFSGLLPLGSQGVLGVSRPLTASIKPMMDSLLDGAQAWMEENWPFGDWLGGDSMNEEDVLPSNERGHELPARSDFNPTDDFRLAVRARDKEALRALTSGQIYLRSRTYDRFDGSGWGNNTDEPRFLDDRADGKVDGWTRVAEIEGGRVLDYEVFLTASTGTELPAVVEVAEYRLETLFSSTPGWFEGGIGGNVHYAARSVLGGRAKADRIVDTTRFLGVPAGDELRELRRVAREIAPISLSRSEKLDRIREFLRERCQYSTRFENPQGLSPLENFLFGERLGYCDHFASATVMMLRARSIPARYAMGFSGGTVDRDQNLVVFTASDAHAWAEIFVDGQWQIFDTTPAGAGAAREAMARPIDGFEERAFSDARAQMEEEEGGEAPAETGSEELREQFTWPHWLVIGLLALGAALLASFLFWLFVPEIVRLHRKRRAEAAKRKMRFSSDEESRPGYLREFFKLTDFLNIFRPTGATVREAVRSAAEAGLQASVLEEMQDYHYASRYAGDRCDRATERRLKREIAELGKARK